MIKFAEDQKRKSEIAFDKERDKMIIVFDGDIFEEKVLDYDELVAEGEKNNILAVSNPAFELFLLLHYENSYEDDIEPNAEQIIQNEKDGHQTFIYVVTCQNRNQSEEEFCNWRVGRESRDCY